MFVRFTFVGNCCIMKTRKMSLSLKGERNMSEKRNTHRGKSGMFTALPFIFIGLAVVFLLIFGVGALINQLIPDATTAPPVLHSSTPSAPVPGTSIVTQPPTTVPPSEPPVHKVSTATIGSTGDHYANKSHMLSFHPDLRQGPLGDCSAFQHKCRRDFPYEALPAR